MAEVTKKEYYRRASNGEGQLFSRTFSVEDPDAAVIILHDMSDHGGRYSEFTADLNDRNYNVYIDDIVGMGQSKQGHRGAFAMKDDGAKYVLEDIVTLRRNIKKEHGDIPVIMVGVGMGAIMAEHYAVAYDRIDMLILIAPLAVPYGVSALLLAAGNTVRINGYNTVSTMVHNLMLPVAKMPGSDPSNNNYWVTADEEELKKYTEDVNCGFPMTASGYLEIVNMIRGLQDKWYLSHMPDIPVLVIGGTEDVLGDFGDAARKCAADLTENGNNEVSVKIYKNALHDLLHSKMRAAIIDDITEWIGVKMKRAGFTVDELHGSEPVERTHRDERDLGVVRPPKMKTDRKAVKKARKEDRKVDKETAGIISLTKKEAKIQEKSEKQAEREDKRKRAEIERILKKEEKRRIKQLKEAEEEARGIFREVADEVQEELARSGDTLHVPHGRDEE